MRHRPPFPRCLEYRAIAFPSGAYRAFFKVANPYLCVSQHTTKMDSREIIKQNGDRWEQTYPEQKTQDQSAYIARYMTKVYGWMFLGLALTGGVAGIVASNDALLRAAYNFRLLFIIGTFLMVGFLALRVHKMSVLTATAVFLGYSALNGLTFGVLFSMFTTGSLLTVFGITAGNFGIMTVIGYVTKQDLTSFGRIMMMGLIGIILASVVNFFAGSTTLYWLISYAGVAIFLGLVAYDTQKIKAYALMEREEDRRKGAIMGALTLYLDFINLFIFLLRLFGGRKD